ncbi:MAG: DMT family transporter [Clostridiaceae bacterium]|nr:DMT family transporter [Clostridiaceae bacterium]
MRINENWKAYLSGTVMSIIFGLTFLFTKEGLRYLSPMVLLAYRFGIAAVILTLLLLLKIVKVDYHGKPIKKVIILSVFYPVISFIFETTGVNYVSVSQAGIMVSLMPIFVMILGMLMLKENPSGIQKLFIAASIAGVIITVAFVKSSGENSNFIGIILLMVSIMSSSMNNVLSRKCSRYFTVVEITFAMLWVGTVFFFLVSVVQGIMKHDFYNRFIVPMYEIRSITAVLYLGLLASVIAFFAMNYMLSKLPVVNASGFSNLSTVISILAGVIIMHETLHWYQIAGGALIISGVIGTNYFSNDRIEAAKKNMIV